MAERLYNRILKPHMHLLLIMSSEDKTRNTEDLDDLICADDGLELRELVEKWTIP